VDAQQHLQQHTIKSKKSGLPLFSLFCFYYVLAANGLLNRYDMHSGDPNSPTNFERTRRDHPKRSRLQTPQHRPLSAINLRRIILYKPRAR
jgi:hypothetical protein